VSNGSRIAPGARKILEARLATGGFTSVESFTKWMRRYGYRLTENETGAETAESTATQPAAGFASPATAQPGEDGERLERRLTAVRRATAQARAIVAEAADGEGSLTDALIRLVQQIDFEILLQLEASGAGELDPRALAEVTRSVATLARASLQQKRWVAATRAELAEKVGAADARLAAAARQGGLSDAAAEQIRNALLEIRV
jgi:hypothetical protein